MFGDEQLAFLAGCPPNERRLLLPRVRALLEGLEHAATVALAADQLERLPDGVLSPAVAALLDPGSHAAAARASPLLHRRLQPALDARFARRFRWDDDAGGAPPRHAIVTIGGTRALAATGVEVSNFSRTAAVRAGSRGDKSLLGAPRVLAHGDARHVFEVRIERSEPNTSMLIGVSDGARAWGFSGLNGRVVSFGDAATRAGFSTGARAMDEGSDLVGRASGSVVRVAVGPRGRLAFRVNGGAERDAGVALPAVVSPWVQLRFPGDRVTLRGGHHFDSTSGA